MRCAIIADIHSNLVAFRAVLDDITCRGGVEEIWCLGDIVGYGPNPRECIELLREYRHCGVAGNHDWAAIRKIDVSDFNPVAAEACNWTAARLDESSFAYLDALPLVLERGDFTLVHGSPDAPIEEYLLSSYRAMFNLSSISTRHCLVGHSHIPMLFVFSTQYPDYRLVALPDEICLDCSERLIVNPGSVGQPRDGDPRASYMIMDITSGSLYHYRVEYDILSVQEKMRCEGLPSRLAIRLSYGQ